MPIGFNAMMTNMKISVSAASMIVSAISFGVFWRLAPSTSAIMRSKNPWPGSAVIRTLISSDNTRVPPVTALRSPPLSRITGADSPVMADSSTVAAPSITSPSPGIIPPARTMTTSPRRRLSASTCAISPFASTLSAVVCVRELRKALACALPRPSATASAKLANKTVNQSQSAIWAMTPRSFVGRKTSTVVSIAPTRVTNITGFLSIARG